MFDYFPVSERAERERRMRALSAATPALNTAQERLNAIENPEVRLREFFNVCRVICAQYDLPLVDDEIEPINRLLNAESTPELYKQYPDRLFIYRLVDGWRYLLPSSSIPTGTWKIGASYPTFEEARDAGQAAMR